MTKKVASETEPDGVGQRKLEEVDEPGIGHLRTLSPWLLLMMMMTKKGRQKFFDTSVQIFSYITTDFFYLRGIQESRWSRASKTHCTPLDTIGWMMFGVETGREVGRRRWIIVVVIIIIVIIISFWRQPIHFINWWANCLFPISQDCSLLSVSLALEALLIGVPCKKRYINVQIQHNINTMSATPWMTIVANDLSPAVF